MPRPATIRFLILGAGPTGLGAALNCYRRQQPFMLLEALDRPGGLASSFVDRSGFTWDLGGHVQFSHYELFDRYMDLALGSDGWNWHQRESWIWIRNRFVPYPLQYNLHRLPPLERDRCLHGLRSALGPAARPRNFAEWIDTVMGPGLAEVFMRPYNRKVWAHPLELLSDQWVGERVAQPDLERVLAAIRTNQDQVSWGPNNRFRFPKSGGTGAIWQALAARLPHAAQRYQDPVVAIDSGTRQLTLASGASYGYEHLISSLPLDTLTHLLGQPQLQSQARRLRRTRTHVVGIGLEGNAPPQLASMCWMYFPEDDSPFYRVTVFSNYSAQNTPRPGETWSLMAEVAESEFQPRDADIIVEQVVSGMRATGLITETAPIISCWHKALDHGYPIPTVERDVILNALLPQLERKAIYSRGRFGAWKYEVSNQDHSFMQGWECIDRLTSGRGAEAEPTLNLPSLVNGQYRRWTGGPIAEAA
jgi:protoporphyrinogen oxidase